jgi:hypothetical protein
VPDLPLSTSRGRSLPSRPGAPRRTGRRAPTPRPGSAPTRGHRGRLLRRRRSPASRPRPPGRPSSGHGRGRETLEQHGRPVAGEALPGPRDGQRPCGEDQANGGKACAGAPGQAPWARVHQPCRGTVAANPERSPRREARCSGSRPVVGSSTTRRSGLPISACAMLRRRRCPPESFATFIEPRSPSSTRSRTRRISACRASLSRHSFRTAR